MPKNLIICDDDEQILEVLTAHLNQSGFLVDCAKSGSSLLDKIKKMNLMVLFWI